MRTFIYCGIISLSILLFCTSLYYLNDDPYDPIGSRLMGYSILSFVTSGVVSLLDMFRSIVLWIIRTLKKK